MPKLGILNIGSGFKPEEITHDLKCENCGDPAEVNYQLVWVSWSIKPDGDYENQEFHDSDTNEFWCSRCWELDRNEEYDKLKEIRGEWNVRLSKL